MKKLWIGAAIALVVVIALAAIFSLRPSDVEGCSKESATTAQLTANSEETATSSAQSEEVKVLLISYEDGNFSPNCVLIKSGDTVTFVNKSDENIEIAADPHPIHTGNKEVSGGEFVLPVAPGKAEQVTLSKTGNTGFHNHLHSSATGLIIVE